MRSVTCHVVMQKYCGACSVMHDCYGVLIVRHKCLVVSRVMHVDCCVVLCCIECDIYSLWCCDWRTYVSCCVDGDA